MFFFLQETTQCLRLNINYQYTTAHRKSIKKRRAFQNKKKKKRRNMTQLYEGEFFLDKNARLFQNISGKLMLDGFYFIL